MKLAQTGRLAPITKPWLLIRDAIHDLRRQERTKTVSISMGFWHEPMGWTECAQCLAGCMISRRLGVDTLGEASPKDFKESVRARLYAINSFRMGEISKAYEFYLKRQRPEAIPPIVAIVQYYKNPQLFKRQMLALATRMEKAHNGKPARKIKNHDD